MVGPRSNTGRTERAQLVLIGAISIAFILLGVVVVLNGVQYTETINSGGAGSDLSEVRMVESELEAGVETLERNGESINDSTLSDYINESYQQSVANQQPVYVWYEEGSWTSTGGGGEFTVTIQTTDVTVTRTIEVDP